DGVTGSGNVTLSGDVIESGVTVLVFDMSTNTDLGRADLKGTAFTKPLHLSEGSHSLRVRSEDGSGNIADSFFDVVADSTGPVATIVLAADQSAVGDGTGLVFRVTFNEAVIGFAVNDLILDGAAGAKSAIVTGSDRSYTVTLLGM